MTPRSFILRQLGIPETTWSLTTKVANRLDCVRSATTFIKYMFRYLTFDTFDAILAAGGTCCPRALDRALDTIYSLSSPTRTRPKDTHFPDRRRFLSETRMRLPMTFDILIALLILNSAQALTIQLTRRQTSDLSPAFKRAFIDAPDQPPLPRTAGPHEVTPPSPQADEPVVRRYYPFLPPADPAFGPPAGGMSRVYGRQAQRQGQKHHRRQQGTSPTTVGNSLDAMATTTATSTPSSFESGSASSSTTPSASPTSSPPGTASASLSSPSVPLSSPTSSTGSTPGSSSLPATLPTSQMTDQASSPQLTLPSPLPSPNNAPPPMPSTSTVPLNNLAAQGITYTVEVKVGNTTVPVVVSLSSSLDSSFVS